MRYSLWVIVSLILLPYRSLEGGGDSFFSNFMILGDVDASGYLEVGDGSTSAEFLPFKKGTFIEIPISVTAPVNATIVVDSSYRGELVHETLDTEAVGYTTLITPGVDFQLLNNNWPYYLAQNSGNSGSNYREFIIKFTLRRISANLSSGHYQDELTFTLND